MDGWVDGKAPPAYLCIYLSIISRQARAGQATWLQCLLQYGRQTHIHALYGKMMSCITDFVVRIRKRHKNMFIYKKNIK
jgi:hypothetical protein